MIFPSIFLWGGYAFAGLAATCSLLIALMGFWQLLKLGPNLSSAVRAFMGGAFMTIFWGYALMDWLPAWGEQIAETEREREAHWAREREALDATYAASRERRRSKIQGCVDAGGQWIEDSCFTPAH